MYKIKVCNMTKYQITI